MLIDWSVSAGLLDNKEHKYFCMMAKHLNVDDTITAVKIYPAQSLPTICFQTETYREGVTG